LSNGERSTNFALRNDSGQILVEKLVSIRILLGNDEAVAPPHLGNWKRENGYGERREPGAVGVMALAR
jgi:hypothetical protein